MGSRISDPGTPTLDQLRVFLAVVELGSFAAAARKLHRATSVISYSMANLELQLGVTLFDRQTTRKPQLTEAGRTVLAEARTIANGVHGLRAKVKGLLQGLEAEVHVVLDVMLPPQRVVDALKSFREAFPTVALHLHMEALGAVTERVINRGAIIGVSGPMNEGIDAIELGRDPRQRGLHLERRVDHDEYTLGGARRHGDPGERAERHHDADRPDRQRLHRDGLIRPR